MRRIANPITLLLAMLAGPAHAAPSNTRFTGGWEGVHHGGLGDQKVVLTVLPRGTNGAAGNVLFGTEEMGKLEHAVVRGDSLVFEVGSYNADAVLTGAHVVLAIHIANGRTHTVELTRAHADTAAALRAAMPPAQAAVVRETVPDSVYAAHAVPPSEVTVAPCLERGTLLLVGGGPEQADIDARLVTLAGGRAARLVACPTASLGIEDSAATAAFAERVRANLGFETVAGLHTLARRRADSDAFVAPIAAAKAVWFSGGEGGWLLASYLGTRTEQALVALLARGGVVAGTSAGALVWGSHLMEFRAGGNKREYSQFTVDDLRLEPPEHFGFGLLRGVVLVPHFHQKHLEPFLERWLAAHPGVLGIGLDEATAIEVHGTSFTVLGRGGVSVYDGRPGAATGPIVLREGARYDLVQRRTL